MIFKSIQKRVELEEDDFIGAVFFPAELEYYLLESIFYGSDDLGPLKTYGVEIIRKEHGQDYERKMFKDVSTSKENVVSLIEKMANSLVTPVTLEYVMEDALGF